MRRVIYAEGEVYHIYNRGTDKREVFVDDVDRLRFIQDLYEMNNSAPVVNSGHYFAQEFAFHLDPDRQQAAQCRIKGEKLVEILEFALMPNHFHLLLRQRGPGGICAFMQKIGTAYTMYFNKRYSRTGMLFQGPYKSINIKCEEHYEWIPHYIHANPLKLQPPFSSVGEAMQFLKSYKWSSFRDYAGMANFPQILDKDLLEEFFARDGGFWRSMIKWLENRQGLPIEAKPR